MFNWLRWIPYSIIMIFGSVIIIISVFIYSAFTVNYGMDIVKKYVNDLDKKQKEFWKIKQ